MVVSPKKWFRRGAKHNPLQTVVGGAHRAIPDTQCGV